MAHRYRSIPSAAFALAPLALAAVGCAGEPPALEIGPVAYSSSEVRLLSPTQRKDLAALAAFGLVASNDLERLAHPSAQEREHRILATRLGFVLAFRHAGIGQAELRHRYAANPDYELVARHILFLSERWRADEHRAAAVERARHALDRARSHPADFGAIAAEVSEEPGAAGRGGKLAPARKGDWVTNFRKAAAALEEGEISGIVESRYGFHIIKLLERRTVPFDDVRGSVLGRLVRERAIAASANRYADSIRAIPAAEWMPRARDADVGLSNDRKLWLFREELAAVEHAAAILGFESGMDPQTIKRTARAALGATNQDKVLARQQVLALEPILRTLYPVVDSRSAASSSDTPNSAESG